MRAYRWSVLIANVWLCAACAGPSTNVPALAPDDVATERHKQETAQLRDYYAQLRRLDTVAFRIRTANRDDCKQWVAAQIGLLAATPQSLPRKYKSVSAEALKLSWDRPTVISVVDGSPAAEAGIVTGDEITAFNGEPIPVTGTSEWIGGFLRRNGEQQVAVALRRDDVERTLELKPVMGCAIPITLETNPLPNAATDYRKIVIQSGLLRMLRTDADLATIVGHELAHVNMGHYGKKLQNALLGGLGGALVDGVFGLATMNTGGTFTRHFFQAGAMAFSVGFEREADYVGAYYATRAGFDISGVEDVWRAMALEDPASIRTAKTHPTTPERFLFLRKVTTEIADKKRRNVALVPELKVTQADAATAAAAAREGNY